MQAERSSDADVVPLHPWYAPLPFPGDDWALSVQVTDDGAALSVAGRPPTAEELIRLGRALVDSGRAVRNGDDPTEVLRSEWQRRAPRPPPSKPC